MATEIDLTKYKRLKKIGLPSNAIRQQMIRQGIDQSVIVEFLREYEIIEEEREEKLNPPKVDKNAEIDRNETIDLIFGYVREAESLLTDFVISDLIIYCIIDFYGSDDYWQHFTENSFEMTNNGRIITKINGDKPRTIYGAKVISSGSHGIHHWKLKIIDGEYIAIGISEAKYDDMEGLFYKQPEANFSWRGPPRKPIQTYAISTATGNWHCPGQEYPSPFCKSLKSGDIIEMIFDVDKQGLSYIINEGTPKDTKAHVGHSSIGYCLAVCIRFENDAIGLLSYYCENGN